MRSASGVCWPSSGALTCRCAKLPPDAPLAALPGLTHTNAGCGPGFTVAWDSYPAAAPGAMISGGTACRTERAATEPLCGLDHGREQLSRASDGRSSGARLGERRQVGREHEDVGPEGHLEPLLSRGRRGSRFEVSITAAAGAPQVGGSTHEQRSGPLE